MNPIPVALITGGASGIGAAVATRLAARGTHVVIADLDERRGERLAEDIDGVFVPTDVSSPMDNKRAVSVAVDTFGGLDMAMLNAGLPGQCGLQDFHVDRYRKTVAVNLDGVVYGLHACTGPMRAQGGGLVIVTSSVAGLRPSPDLIYAASKHAVIGLVRSAAIVLGEHDIQINALCPGLIDTPLISSYREDLLHAGMALAEPTQVAEAVDTILTDNRTGQVWVVQAGQRAHRVEFADPALVMDPSAQA